jgi:hypothetical protein
MRLFFFILAGMFLIIGKVSANEIIIKDCYAVSKYGKNEFNTKRYTQYYYKIDQKSKTITEVWSYTNNEFEETKKSMPDVKKTNIFKYNLEFIDNNFANGKAYGSNNNLIAEITIDLKKNYVEKQFNLKPTAINATPSQCKK